MVLGLRTKNRRGATVQVHYLIHIQEIKPWPPSQSLKSLRSVMIQWENGDRSSGSTCSVIPSIGSVIGEGRIEFNESFKLSAILSREMSIKGGDSVSFQKNCLEFNLYEPRRDRTVKGQLLGTAIVDLADYGVLKETVSINTPLNCKRNFRNTAQPILFIKIQPVNKGLNNSLSRDSLSREMSMDRNGGESVSALMKEEYAEEAEFASFTDDDVSSHSSTVASCAPDSIGAITPQNEEITLRRVKDSTRIDSKEHEFPLTSGTEESNKIRVTTAHENQMGTSSCTSSVDLSSGAGSPVNGPNSLTNFSEFSPALIPAEIFAPNVQSSSSSTANETVSEECKASRGSHDHGDPVQEVQDRVVYDKSATRTNAQESTEDNTTNNVSEKLVSAKADLKVDAMLSTASNATSYVSQLDGENALTPNEIGLGEDTAADDIHMVVKDGNNLHEHAEEKQIEVEGRQTVGEGQINNIYQEASTKQFAAGSSPHSYITGHFEVKGNIGDRLRHVKSVRSSSDSSKRNGSFGGIQFLEGLKEANVVGDKKTGARIPLNSEKRDLKIHQKEKNTNSNSRIEKLEHKIKMLEGELREAAAVEAALYSVVAEHGSSMSKVHAPARRLSRLYLHAFKESSSARKANAARTAVSGLVLVGKACGNDVPRLTFWLSNSVVLRAIISQSIVDPELPLSDGPFLEKIGAEIEKQGISLLKWKKSFSSVKDHDNALFETNGAWEDPRTFASALEKIEAWIFSRIIESVWWQTLTPRMQSAAAKAIDKGVDCHSKKLYTRMPSLDEQGKFSLDLWKEAFKDACGRLCPVRAGGHECGCLPVLARMIMEKCVARLDVAMFNAILRESADEIPTDPVSDPISDLGVLPILSGKSSFGAGAQLKNAIGNWSRWLSDLFGMDDDDLLEEDSNDDDERRDTSSKSFNLLSALSDLMMLPKDMLLSRSIRKEVCPKFGAPLIKRILNNFVPDEFCSDPVPDDVMEALDCEDSLEVGEDYVANFPCIAGPPIYLAPSAAFVAHIIGEITNPQLRRSGSSLLRKSYTSDDELEELDSPLTSIFMDGSRSSPMPMKANWISKKNDHRHAVRYQLLREIWMDSA